MKKAGGSIVCESMTQIYAFASLWHRKVVDLELLWFSLCTGKGSELPGDLSHVWGEKRGRAMRIHSMDSCFCTTVALQNVGTLIFVVQSVGKNVSFNLRASLVDLH